MAIGKQLKHLRKQNELTLKQLGEKLGIPYTTLHNYEQEAREPNLAVLEALALFFDVSVDYLMGVDRIPSKAVPPQERALLQAYRDNPDMRPAVDRLLGIDQT